MPPLARRCLAILPLLLLSAAGFSRAALAVSSITFGVSHGPNGSAALTGAAAEGPSASADGRYVAFISTARNYGVDSGGKRQVFVRDCVLDTTTLVSVSNGGVPADDDCWRVAMSADGGRVAFSTSADNLTPGAPELGSSVVVRDLAAGFTELVSVNSAEQPALALNGTEALAISGDGRFVAFTSDAADLAPGDSDPAYDVFVRDRLNGTTELGSVEPEGVSQGSRNGVQGIAISGDGRCLAFHSQEPGSGGQEGAEAVLVRDRQQGITERVSVSGDGVSANGPSTMPSLSADGRYAAFRSSATNLVPGDTNGYDDVFVHDRQTGATTRVSVSSTGGQGSSDSASPVISPDGRYVAFWSGASDLTPDPFTPFADAFLHDQSTGTTVLVSVGSGGEIADQGSGYFPDPPTVSAGALRVGFTSLARNLVAGDTNGKLDVFLRDRAAATTERVSVGAGGAQGVSGATSSVPALSGTGRYVAFVSDAFNLVPEDTNGEPDVFVWDRVLDITERVSLAGDGDEGNGPSSASREVFYMDAPAISADGRYVAFTSWASNLVQGDANAWCDVFVHDRVQGSTELVSLRGDGSQANSVPDQTPSLSGDGRLVAFVSIDQLVPEDTNHQFDVYVRDRQLGTVAYASKPLSGESSSGWAPALSGDGRCVAFESADANLVPEDTNGSYDVFVRDLARDITERASLSAAGQQGNAESYRPAISADGRYIAFTSGASNLVAGDIAFTHDVFVRDRANGATERINVAWNQSASTGQLNGGASISADGRFVSYSSLSANIVSGDTNGATDVFVRDRLLGRSERVSVASDGMQDNTPPNWVGLNPSAMSADGRYVAWSSEGNTLVAGDTNGSRDVFLRDRGSLGIPNAPSNLQAQATMPLRAHLTWMDQSSDEGCFRIERRIGSGSFGPLTIVAANVTTFDDTSLAPSTTYEYRVLAATAGGDSLPSNVAAISIPAPPSAPQLSPAEPLSGFGLRIAWSPGAGELLSFRVERSPDQGATWELVGEPAGDARVIDDAGLLPDHQYQYRVTSLNAGGASPFGTTTGRTLPLPPAAPTGLQVTLVGQQFITLQWTVPAGLVSGYSVERRMGAGAFVEVGGTASTQFADFGLVPGAAYSYRVSALNDGGASAPSEIVTASTTPLPPGRLRVSAKRLNFGVVRTGKTAKRWLVLHNTSRTHSLWVNPGAPSAPFGLSSPGSSLLAPGKTMRLQPSFQPTVRGKISLAWSIASSDPQQDTVQIMLTGVGK